MGDSELAASLQRLIPPKRVSHIAGRKRLHRAPTRQSPNTAILMDRTCESCKEFTRHPCIGTRTSKKGVTSPHLSRRFPGTARYPARQAAAASTERGHLKGGIQRRQQTARVGLAGPG